MDNPIMFRTRLMSVLIASVIGSSFGNVLRRVRRTVTPKAGQDPFNLPRPAAPTGRTPRSAAPTKSHTRPPASATALRYFTTVMGITCEPAERGGRRLLGVDTGALVRTVTT